MLALRDLALITKNESLTDFTIYVDNQAVLKTLNMVKLKGESRVNLINEVKAFEQRHNCRILFKWVKGHSGVFGNELADEQAKMGCSSNDIHYLSPSLAYIKSKVKERTRKEWQRKWEGLSDCRQSRFLINFEPNKRSTKYLFSKGRLGTRKMVALLTGHNNFKYHVYKKTVNSYNNSSPCCRYCCEELETSQHLLLDCPCLDTRRREFTYSSENPKTGPDIEWYFGLANALGIWDLILDRTYLEWAENEMNGDIL